MSQQATSKPWIICIDVAQEALSIEFPHREPYIIRGEEKVVQFIAELCDASNRISLAKIPPKEKVDA